MSGWIKPSIFMSGLLAGWTLVCHHFCLDCTREKIIKAEIPSRPAARFCRYVQGSFAHHAKMDLSGWKSPDLENWQIYCLSLDWPTINLSVLQILVFHQIHFNKSIVAWCVDWEKLNLKAHAKGLLKIGIHNLFVVCWLGHQIYDIYKWGNVLNIKDVIQLPKIMV